jgi:hypothetical protein
MRADVPTAPVASTDLTGRFITPSIEKSSRVFE